MAQQQGKLDFTPTWVKVWPNTAWQPPIPGKKNQNTQPRDREAKPHECQCGRWVLRGYNGGSHDYLGRIVVVDPHPLTLDDQVACAFLNIKVWHMHGIYSRNPFIYSHKAKYSDRLSEFNSTPVAEHRCDYPPIATGDLIDLETYLPCTAGGSRHTTTCSCPPPF